MPLPVFPKNRRKSCVPPSTSIPTASSSTPTSGGTTGTKSPTCPSSPKNSSRRIVVHHQKKKSSDNNNSWHKLQKSKESDFLKNHNHNAVIVKVAHRWYFIQVFYKLYKDFIVSFYWQAPTFFCPEEKVRFVWYKENEIIIKEEVL